MTEPMSTRDGQRPEIPDPGDEVDPVFAAAVGAEDLDEDRPQRDPLEEGMDPPEGWSASDRVGVTSREQREGESLDDRLAQEEPEILGRGQEDAVPPADAAEESWVVDDLEDEASAASRGGLPGDPYGY
ncbi:hypothetical protein GCM10023147_07410 [Tsukamurella soli]|uniref:DUF5709 domain-containing protein n=1 Tax=Tsukamurella soli TaxID=644556 RepID=A0ABP8J5V4_9ACTN